MKTLLLLRHARPSQTSPTGRDFDRPLIDAGRADARLVGQTFRQRNLAPDVIVRSPAARARETTDIVAEAAQLSARPRFDERLFDAGTEQILGIIAGIEDDAAMLLIVGHNPGLTELILRLTGASERVTPGTLAGIELDIAEWGDVRAANTRRLAFILAPGDT